MAWYRHKCFPDPMSTEGTQTHIFVDTTKNIKVTKSWIPLAEEPGTCWAKWAVISVNLVWQKIWVGDDQLDDEARLWAIRSEAAWRVRRELRGSINYLEKQGLGVCERGEGVKWRFSMYHRIFLQQISTCPIDNIFQIYERKGIVQHLHSELKTFWASERLTNVVSNKCLGIIMVAHPS